MFAKTVKDGVCMECIVYKHGIRGSIEKFFTTFYPYLWFKTWQKLCLETVAQEHEGFGILLTGYGRRL